MKILAIESSSSQRSVAALVSGAGGAIAAASEVIEAGQGGSNTFGMIDQALKQAGLEREQIECLAVGIGPGSYTGIRAAIATAQGWQLAKNIKLLGISSVDCIAAQAQADGLAGRARVIIDAQRKELYVAVYQLSSSGWRVAVPLRLRPVAALLSDPDHAEHTIGPEASRWFAEGREVFPRAGMLARLALQRSDYLPGNEIEPIYLRETTFAKAPPPRLF